MELGVFINEDVFIPHVNFIYDPKYKDIDIYHRGTYLSSINPDKYKLELCDYYQEEYSSYSYRLVKR